jgi:hypothetical protein
MLNPGSYQDTGSTLRPISHLFTSKYPAAYTSLNGKLHVPLVLVVLRVSEEQIVKVESET